jgi:hypothetical protein
MKLTKKESLRAGNWLGLCLIGMALGCVANAQGFSTTTVQGTVYLANGQPGTGTLQVSWPGFTTTANQAVAAGRTNVTIGADGFVSLSLAPNLGATPAGLYYTAVYHLSDGTTSTEYWVVPSAAQANLSQVRAELMPATQAVQAVSKGYVDQSITELTQSLLTASGGSLSGPLYLNGDPSAATQAATKHYVDQEFSQTVPITGATMSGPLTSVQLGAVYQADQFPGGDFGARLQACISGLSKTYGGTCDARNFTGNLSMDSNLMISIANVTVQLPCATIATANQIIVTAGMRNVTLHGCALRGASSASGSQGGTVFLYSGAGAMVQVGDPTYAADTAGFHIDNAAINTTAANSSTAQGMAAYRTQEMDVASLYFLGNSNQTGMTLDGTGNYTGGTFQDIEFSGFATAVNAIGHQSANAATTDWVNASTFVRLHIDCPTNWGNPISGTYGINLLQGDGNTFTGGDVEGCSTALHLGPNAQNNTIVGLRNENSTNQIVAEAGSSYNNWMTGGTMFTGQLIDNGTRNSFLDTFHRSFNGLNGDWYGSQQDATVTNHYRIGIGAGNERGLLNRYQTDYGYRWTTGFSDATAGEQFYQLLDELNNVYRLSIGQYNNGQGSTNNQTVVNAAGTGAVVLNGSTNAGTGGVVFGAGGASGATVATINNAGNAQFNGSLEVGGPATFTNSTTVRNQADGEIDAFLWAGATANQKESFIYKDYTGASQWYLLKDASNNWALNSATGGLDSIKAYQSTNSGDTYINASNATGHIRLNYESGSGAETDIYSGSGSGLVAAFLGTTAIKLPGLAAGSGRSCLQIDTSGYISNTGTNCGGGNGTVGTGTAGQVAYYTGNGAAIAGMNAVSVTAGGTGASTAAAALQNLGGQSAMAGVSSDGTTGMKVSGNVAAATTNSSVNKVLVVTAPPYNAKCDGVTDDQTAIQAAFTDALPGSSNALCSSTGCSLQFPAGKCLTSTITWKGQSFFGAGMNLTTVQGMPGEDVFQSPDTATANQYGAYIHDLAIAVDGSVNAASSNAPMPGNNTFPNRISGTYPYPASYTAPVVNPLPASSGGAPAPGPVVFGAAPLGGGATATASTCTVTIPNMWFASWSQTQQLAGAPITINGAGVSGANLTTTIASASSNTQITLNPPCVATSVTNASGSLGSPLTAPWYVGVAGIAVQGSCQQTTIAAGSRCTTSGALGLNGMLMKNIWFKNANSNNTPRENYTAGLFLQSPCYDCHFEKVDFQNLWYGYVEAQSPLNFVDNQTPDTATYKDLNFKSDAIAMITYNGSHRIIDGISIYGANNAMATGLWELKTPNGYPSMEIHHFYYECWSYNSGEMTRFSGSSNNIQGGALGQCSGIGGLYVNYAASYGLVNAGMPGLMINGNGNVFTNLGSPVTFQDNGIDNRASTPIVQGAYNRNLFLDRPREPLNKLDGGWLLSGNSTTPFTSGDDLISTCSEWSFAITGGNGSPSGCTSDPTGTEISESYAHLLATPYASGWILGADAISPYGKLWTVGDRVPQGQMTLIVQGRCNTACTEPVSVYYYDTMIHNLSPQVSQTCTWGVYPAWGTCRISVNASSVPLGDSLSIHGGAVSGGQAYLDLAMIAFEPQNPDIVGEVASSPVAGAAMQGTAPTQGFLMFPCAPFLYTAGSSSACVTDSTSPFTGQAATLTATSVNRVAGLGGTLWTMATPTAATSTTIGIEPYDVAVTAEASSSLTETVTVQCGLTTLSTQSLTFSTTYTTQHIYAPFQNCSTGQPSISFPISSPTTLTVGGITMTPFAQVAGAASAGQIPLSVAVGNLYYYIPTSLSSQLASYATLASPAFTGTPTAPTAAPGTNNTQVATMAAVQTAVSGAAGAICTDWTTPGVKTGGEGVLVNANQTTIWSFEPTCSVTFTKISYTPSTSDNTSNMYDIGIYAANGSTLLCHSGATAGTAFAPGLSTYTATVPSCSLTAGTRYIFAYTGTATTAVLNGGGLTLLGVNRANVSAATTGGALNSTITVPADSWGSTNGFPLISLHN